MRLATVTTCLEIAIGFSIVFASDLKNLDQGGKSETATHVTSEESIRIDKFIVDYYRALSRRDLDSVLANFATNVDYLGGERNKDYVRKDLAMYLRRWPSTTFAPKKIVVSAIDDHTFLVHFTLSYTVRNSAASNSGFAYNVWVLREIDGKFQICSQKEIAQAKVAADAVSQPPKSLEHAAEESQSPITATPVFRNTKDARSSSQGPQVQVPTAKATATPQYATSITSRPLRRLANVPEGSTPPAEKGVIPHRDFAVALDVGHSKLQGGAISARGVFEYEFNRRLVGELFELLQSKGFSRSFIINPNGAEIRLLKRAETANNRNADLFLAIHHDSVKDSFLKDWKVDGKTQKFCDEFHGYSVFFSRKNAAAEQSRAFALELGEALLDAGLTPTLHHAEQEHRPIIDREKGVYAFDDLLVLKGAKMPAVLLECGVIVNRAEEEELNTREYRSRIIDAIEAAIAKFAADPTTNAKRE